MKRLLTILFLASGTITFAQKKTDFSGTFKANVEKTNLGAAPEYIIPRFITTTQQKDRIIISRVHLDGKLAEQPAIADTLTYAGKVATRTSKSGAPVTAVMKWLNDQSFQVDLSTKDVTIQETWTLEDGGKALLVVRDTKQSNGMNFVTNAYYDRQK